MFFDDEKLVAKRGSRVRQAPPIPETGWRPPTEFPNLSAATAIAFDCETFDPLLKDRGPGWDQGFGRIVGISIAARARDGSQGAWYFPTSHELETHLNMDERGVFGFADSVLSDPSTDKVGANLTYDIGWCNRSGIRVNGPLHDVQFAEPLLDEEAQINLDALSNKYLGYGKETESLYSWLAAAYGGNATPAQRANIYRSPVTLAGPYAIKDAENPFGILDKQWPILTAQGLDFVYRLECDLIPLMIAMRNRGIPVDVDYAQKLMRELEQEIAEEYVSLCEDYGVALDSTDSRQLAKLFDVAGVEYTVKESGNPSITKEFLADLDHPLGDRINDLREREKSVGTFLKGYILDKNVNGRLHPQFHQLKADDSGTIVGRFSSSVPNLQNIPSRTKLGKRIREAFIKSKGAYKWRKMDYSQIHYRILANYAVDKGDGSADELRRKYTEDKKMDYHDSVYFNVCPIMGWDASDDELRDFRRRPIKNVNFGLLYGQSEAALARKVAAYFGSSWTNEEVKQFFAAYFEGAPYVKPTMEEIGKEVQRCGYVTTVLGRRVRFNYFEPAGFGRKEKPLKYHQALRTYGAPLKRAYEYRGVNYKFQGSEPDIMKSGMRACWNSGVFDVVGVPLLTCHDELDFDVLDDSPQTREAFDFIQHTMENTVKLRVPIRVDVTDGDNWGKAK